MLLLSTEKARQTGVFVTEVVEHDVEPVLPGVLLVLDVLTLTKQIGVLVVHAAAASLLATWTPTVSVEEPM